MGFTYRKHFFNEKYFDQIDTEGKAYFFGLLCADGYSSIDKNFTCIGLQEKDKDILDKFKINVGYNENLLFIKGGIKRNKNYSNEYKLYLNSKHMCKSLYNLGIDNKKTESLNFSTFDYLTNHFVRGYFDGDGCLMLPKNTKNWHFSIISSTKFIIGLKQYIKKQLNINCNIYKPKCYKKDVSTLQIHGNKQIEKILYWMYKNSTIFLNRKYNKYQEFLEFYKNMKIKIPKYCSFPDCNKKLLAKNLCLSHYSKMRKGTLYKKHILNKDTICSFDKCNKHVFSKNLCKNHYNNKWYHEHKIESSIKES